MENGGQRWQIQANDQARKAEDYLPLIVSYRNGAPVRIADLGEVVDSVEDLRNTGLKNGKPSVLLILRKQPLANVIQTVDQVQAMLPQLRAAIPSAIDLSVVVDRSLTIRASITEVEHSLLIAIGLVILVVLVFLRRFAFDTGADYCGAGFTARRLCGHVFFQLQSEQSDLDGVDHLHRLCGRRRHRGPGKHQPAHRKRRAAV